MRAHVFVGSVVIGIFGIVGALLPLPARAADASQFDPNNIISDSVFFNAGLMSESQVQSFLVSRESNCSPTMQPGCLSSYRVDIQATPGYALGSTVQCLPISAESNVLASHAIWVVANACGINPQVILVTLEKEQGLVTSLAPSLTMYQKAMGFACPDSSACDSTYYGLFNQLYYGARQFNKYVNPVNSGVFKFWVGRASSVAFSPTSSCGYSTITPQSRATAALYNYTPYRPNAAALANLYGAGDSCSSYGNRNFWRLFTDWFGSTTVSTAQQDFVKALYQDLLNRAASSSETVGWAKNIAGGMSPAAVAAGFTQSDEYRLLTIGRAYSVVLGRAPDPSGQALYLQAARNGQIAPDDLYRLLLQSDEYFSSTGSSTGQPATAATADTYIAALYEKLLGRAASSSEIIGWTNQFAIGGRPAVVNGIWFSVEAEQRRVDAVYEQFLGRDPEPAARSSWAQYALANGDPAMRAMIVGSLEYWNRASARFA